MIIVRLNGGLGNQLFQYAAAFALEKKNFDIFKIDNSELLSPASRGQVSRKFSLGNFRISAQVASIEEIRRVRYPLGLLSYLYKMFQKKILRKYYVDWHPETQNLKGNIYLDGYFQSEKYFLEYSSELLNELVLSEDSKKEAESILFVLENHNPTVALHIRLGDYVSNPRVSKSHNICGKEYFDNAINYFRQELGNFSLIIFSDDVSWVKNNMQFPVYCTYIADIAHRLGINLNESQEMIVMSRCDHQIISNSSFSWWGAYINKAPNKIVVAPDIWTKGSISQSNILPSSWIRMPIN